MGDHSRAQIDALLAAYDCSGIIHLVDVGGGRGLRLKVLAAYTALRGTVFDQPQVVAPVAVPPELAARLSVQGGDLFVAVPAGADAYLLKHINHDWGDDAWLRILEPIRAAMARVLLVGQEIPHPATLLSPASCST